MTDTIPETIPTDTWAAELAQLRARYKHVREPILVALNILMHDENVALEDAKARAAMRGAKITAASVNAAQRLLARREEHRAVTGPIDAAATPTKVVATVRSARPPQPATNAEALIRDVVQKLQGQGNAEAERLRAAMRKAMAVLQAAVDG
jgi:S1-C subfamily serine protease